jgi:hypothetical protein
LSEDGSFDTANEFTPEASAAQSGKGREAEATPMELGTAKGADFPETEEEKERKIREEEEDKTPARTWLTCVTCVSSVHVVLMRACWRVQRLAMVARQTSTPGHSSWQT